MKIPYRTRRFLRRLGQTLLVLFLIAVVAWICWVVWLERFVVYSGDGARLDFDRGAEFSGGVIAVPPETKAPISIFYNEGDNAISISKDLQQLQGYCITGEALADISAVRTQLSQIESDIPLLIDVKNARGAFYYSTGIGTLTADSVSVSEVDALIRDLVQSEHYLIARLPAMRDREYGLNNVNCGLFAPSRYSLWMDEGGCYWLDPSASGTMTYLTGIVQELKDLGFDEVVFTDFYFPDSKGYVFDGDKSTALTDAAQSLVTACTTETFAVSFVRGSTAFTTPNGRSRIYIQDTDASKAASIAAELGLDDPAVKLVFLTDSFDTRFDEYGTLRPIENAR